MTQSFPVSGRDRAHANQIFGTDERIAGWLRAGFLNRLIHRAAAPNPARLTAAQSKALARSHDEFRAPTRAEASCAKLSGDAEASWTVCLDRGAGLPRRRLSILSDQGAAPLMRIEGFRAENIYAVAARVELR